MTGQDYSSAFSELRSSIRGLYRRDGLSWLAGSFFAWALVTLTLDYFLHLPWLIRLAHLSALAVGLVVLYRRRLSYPLSRVITDDDVALALEATHPRLADRLISSVQFERNLSAGDFEFPETADLARAVIADTRREASHLDVRSVLDPETINRRAWGATALGILFGICVVFLPQTVQTWAKRDLLLTNTPWPQRVYLDLRSPMDVSDPLQTVFTVSQGKDVDVLVYADEKGDNPGSVWIHYSAVGSGTGRTIRQGMRSTTAQPRQYGFTFHNVRDDLTFYVAGGDDKTRTITIHTLVPPTVRSPEVTLTFPEYTLLGSMVQPGGDVKAPVGTRIAFTAQTNKPVRYGELIVDSRNPAAGSRRDPQPGGGAEGEAMAGSQPIKLRIDPEGETVSAEFVVTTSTTYTISLESVEGMLNERAAVYQVIARPDAPPRVRVDLPGRSLQATSIASLPFAGRITDDYGIIDVRFRRTLGRSLGGGGSGAQPVDPGERDDEQQPMAIDEDVLSYPEPGSEVASMAISRLHQPLTSREIAFTHLIDLEGIRVQEVKPTSDGAEGAVTVRSLAPGDRILYHFAARDIGADQVGTSPDYEISIVSVKHLERELADQIKDIQIRLKRMKVEAEKLESSLVEFQSSDAAGLTSAQLTAAEASQGRLTRETSWVEERLGEIRTTKERNRLATTEELEALGVLVTKAGFARDHAQAAEGSLHGAVAARAPRDRSQQLASALESETALIGQLRSLIEDLLEYEDFQSIVMQLRNLREDHEGLLNRTRGLVGGAGDDDDQDDDDPKDDR